MSTQGIDFTNSDYNHEGSELQIKTRPKSEPYQPTDGIIVDIKGDLNLYSTPALKQILTNLVDAGKIKIFVNVENLNYIDSSGLGAFLAHQSKLMKMSGYIKLCCPTKQVLAVLELTKLKSMLKVSSNLEEALKSS
ncbi:MAG: STAS domain-containing protein [Leptospiraceae bacterium]|nr:STAS domain-containing protein [Leptospiraceae bacterium]